MHAPFHSRYCCFAVFVDQADVLRRIEDRGIGRGLAKTATVTEITRAVEEVTANDRKIERLNITVILLIADPSPAVPYFQSDYLPLTTTTQF